MSAMEDDDDFDPNQGHEHKRLGGYEHEAGTQMLATHCFVCGRPLRDPTSIEDGIGPICAEKFGALGMTGQRSEDLLTAALETAPEKLRNAVTEKLESGDARAAVSAAIHAAGNHWLHRTKDYALYVGAAMEIADALGYHGTATALRKVVIEGGKYDEDGNRVGSAKPNGVVITDLGDGRWSIALPFIESKAIWWGVMNGLKSVPGFRNRQVGRLWEASFPSDERTWLLIVNAMVGNLSGTLGVMPNGETFIVPAEALNVPALPQAVVGPPTEDTGEKPEPLPEIAKGTVVTLKDGRDMIVGWVGQGRIGVSATGRPKYEFIGTDSVQTVRTTPEVVKQVEEITAAPVPREVRERELPSKMMPYQRESAMWLDAKGSGVLALDMGLGKTLCALSVADAPIVVVCPATLRINWVREIGLWRPDLTASTVTLGTGPDWAKKAKRAGILAAALKASVVVVNYDILKGEILESLIARGCETLICDEAHALKELKVGWKRGTSGEWEPKLSGSARAINVWHLAQKAKRRFMLTGTPMINGRPYELFPLLHLVAPKEWPSFTKYCNEYCAPKKVHVGGGKYATDYKGSSNLKELNERIQGTFMLRKTKDELDLPEKSRRSTLVALDEDSAKHYRAAADRFIAWVRENGGIEAALRADRARVIAQLTALRRLCAIGKASAVAEAAVDFCAGGRPLVIMGHHREALTAVVAALSETGLRVGTITGEDSDAARVRNKDLFQTGEPEDAPPEQRRYLDVLVCSIAVAGTGLTLTRASDMFFIERAWRPFDLVQAEDRLHRIGQVNKVIINYFDAAGTVDVKIAKLLANKLATAAQVIDGENLSETEAQERVLGEMFGEGAEEFLANQSGDADDDLPEWADPES